MPTILLAVAAVLMILAALALPRVARRYERAAADTGGVLTPN